MKNINIYLLLSLLLISIYINISQSILLDRVREVVPKVIEASNWISDTNDTLMNIHLDCIKSKLSRLKAETLVNKKIGLSITTKELKNIYIMSISKLFKRTLTRNKELGYDKTYWAIDLHGVCFKSNYKKDTYKLYNSYVELVLRLINKLPGHVIILWSSCHEDEYQPIIDLFLSKNVRIDYFNENPEISNTASGCFDKKFYYSIGLDDKFGFDPDKDWLKLYKTLKEINHEKIQIN